MFYRLGILPGPFAGAFLGEVAVKNGLRSSVRAGIGAWSGLLLPPVAELASGLSMLGTYGVVRLL